MKMLEQLPKTQKERLLGMLQEKYPGYHPLISIAEIAHDEDVDLRTKLACHQTIVKYVESELKSVEVRAEIVEEKLVRVSLFDGEYEVIPDTKALEDRSTNPLILDEETIDLVNV